MAAPPLYQLSHIVIGYASYHLKFLWPLILFYQLIQYVLGVRFFFFSSEIKKGNSLSHTVEKLLDYVVGYLIAIVINNSKNE